MKEQEILQRSKKAFVRGFINQALALGVNDDQAVSSATKAASFREEVVKPETAEKLEKRASLLKDSILGK